MNDDFLELGNVSALVEGMNALMNRPPGVPCLAVVHGNAGRGKTMTTHWYAVNKGGRYMVANQLWSERWMLSDLYAALKGIRQADFSTKKKAWEECLRLMKADSLPLIIDEADRICRKVGHLEAIRDLSDRTGTPVVFVGTDEVLFRLQQRETLASRISEVIPFKPLSLEEVHMVARDLYDLELQDDCAAELLKLADGYIRDLVVALAHLERAVRSSQVQNPPLAMVSDVARRAIKRAA